MPKDFTTNGAITSARVFKMCAYY